MNKDKKVIESVDDSVLVIDYEPKEFPIMVTSSAQEFVSSQIEKANDFVISELVADQTGINKVKRESIENQIEERALSRVKEIEERAYREAYELGLIEGTEKAFEMRKQELIERVNDINSLLKMFQEIKKRLLIENEEALVKLCVSIASKIAMKEIKGQEDSILTLLKSTVEELQAEDSIRVIVSDEDLFFLESLREKTGTQIELLDRLKLESSDQITSGGCVVETNNGSIDARVKNRIDKAWDAIVSRLPKYREQNEEPITDVESMNATQVIEDTSESDPANSQEGDNGPVNDGESEE